MAKYNSSLDKEQKKKKELAEDMDYLRQVDQLPSDQAQDFVVATEREKEKKEMSGRADTATHLQGKKNFGYRESLAQYGMTRLGGIEWPAGWERYVLPTSGDRIKLYGKWFATKEGMVCVLKNPLNQVYVRAVLTTNDPIVDMRNVDTLVTQAENTLDSYKGLLLSDTKEKKTASGIYLPE